MSRPSSNTPPGHDRLDAARIVRFGTDSAARLIAFDSLAEAARMTVSFLSRPAIALSGGSTFASLFPHWRALAPQCAHTAFYPVDERLVPFESDQSNWGTAYREFLIHVGRAADKQHFPTSPEQFGRILRERFGPGIPRFDVVFLGLGEDGHTASLFPDAPELDDYFSPVLQTHSPRPPTDRLTLGLSALIHAREVVVIIAGENKRGAAKALLESDARIPLRRVLEKRTDSLLFFERNLLGNAGRT